MQGGIDYTWTMIGDKLIIEFFKDYVAAELPNILEEIISLISEPECIKLIEIGRVPAVVIYAQDDD